MATQLAPPPSSSPSPPESLSARSRNLRVALLTNENTPYRIPLYRELGATPGWDFRVYTCIDREHDRLWEVADDLGFQTKKSFSLRYSRKQRVDGPGGLSTKRQVHLPIGVLPDLLRYGPDVVITSEFGARSLLASVSARLSGHRLLLYSESTPHTEAAPSRAQRALRNYLRKRVDDCLCNGVQARQFLEELGVKSSGIHEIGQAIDLGSFDNDVDGAQRDQFRIEFGAVGTTFLYVGHLIFTKGLRQLLEAWERFSAAESGEKTLLLAGEGHDREALQTQIAEAGLRNVRLLGFVPRDEISRVYAAADVFVFPTLRDCFSLAFEEAMASGLPVIGSVYGGESELVEPGQNGWVADPLDVEDLTEKLNAAWAHRGELRAMGAHARKAVGRMDIPLVASRIRDAVTNTLEKPARSRARRWRGAG